MPIIRNAMATFTAVPIANPIQAARPALPALATVAMRRQLANDGADEWADDHAGQTEEEPGSVPSAAPVMARGLAPRCLAPSAAATKSTP